MADNKERRIFSFNCEMRAGEDGKEKPVLIGMPIVYEKYSENFGTRDKPFHEIITKGAAREALKTSDVIALYDHDTGQLPLGNTRAETLELEETESGVQARIYPPNSEWGRSLIESVRRGDLDRMSFAFSLLPGMDEYTDTERRINTFDRLYDVSVVPFAAYPDTSVMMRNLEQMRTTEQRNMVRMRDADALAEIRYLELLTKRIF